MLTALRAFLAPFNTKTIGTAGVTIATTSAGSLVHLVTSAEWLHAMYLSVLHHRDAMPLIQAVAAFTGIAIGLLAANIGASVFQPKPPELAPVEMEHPP